MGGGSGGSRGSRACARVGGTAYTFPLMLTQLRELWGVVCVCVCGPHVGSSAHVKHIYHAYAAYARPQPTAPFVSAFAVEAANCKFPQLDAIANATPHVNSVGNSQGLDSMLPTGESLTPHPPPTSCCLCSTSPECEISNAIIYSPGLPLTLSASSITHNAPIRFEYL